MLFDFKGKNALVTGGTSGIGKNTALRLKEAGANVMIIGRNEEAGKEMETKGIHFYKCDATKYSEIKETFAKIKNDYQTLDILVNVAGIGNHTFVSDITEEEWDLLYNVDLKNMFFCSQEAIPLMLAGGRGGRIVSLSSIYAESADGKHVLYGGAKAATRAVSRNIAVAYAKDGITSNTVSPSFTRTGMTEHRFQSQEFVDALCKKTPANRLLEVDEVTSAILFLCSDEASGITGENIAVDLGLNLRR